MGNDGSSRLINVFLESNTIVMHSLAPPVVSVLVCNVGTGKAQVHKMLCWELLSCNYQDTNDIMQDINPPLRTILLK